MGQTVELSKSTFSGRDVAQVIERAFMLGVYGEYPLERFPRVKP
jgi:hypothetical protein